MNTICLLAMTWDEVNAAIIAILALIGLVVTGLVALTPKIVELIKKFGEIQSAVASLQKVQSKHSDQITANSQDITKVALATPVSSLDALKEVVKKQME